MKRISLNVSENKYKASYEEMNQLGNHCNSQNSQIELNKSISESSSSWSSNLKSNKNKKKI